MTQFPVNLNIRNRPAVIVGGGAIATRKCLLLLEAGARVTVIAPSIAPRLEELAGDASITCRRRPYAAGDLQGTFLVFAATNDPAVNLAVAREASDLGILADIVDAPERGNFTTPAVMHRGDLAIAVSTGGKSPALARRLRNDLARQFGPEYAETLAILGAVREKLLTARGNTPYNKSILRALADANLPELIRQGEYNAIDRLLATHAGPGFTLAALGTRPEDLP